MLASSGHDQTVRLWDVATGKELSVFRTQEKMAVRCVAFSPDGRRLMAPDLVGSTNGLRI